MEFKLSDKIKKSQVNTHDWILVTDIKEFIRLSRKIRILDFVKVSKLGVLEFDKVGYDKEIDKLIGGL